MPDIPMIYVWLALAVIFFIAEVATTTIVSIWFGIGSVAALLAAWAAPHALWLQLIVFAAVTAVTLYFTRPVLSRWLLKKTPTNADVLIGRKAEVITPIKPNEAGRVKVGDLSWMAKSDSDIAAGEMCTIIKIEGASLIVEKAAAKTCV